MSKQHAAPLIGATVAAACAAHTVRNAHLDSTPAKSALPVATPANVRHLLARFTYGPTSTDAHEVARLGLDGWFEAQLALAPESHAGSPSAHALAEPEDVIAAFGATFATDPVDTEQIALRKEARRVNVKELIATVAAAQVARHVESRAQLHALMVDFWTNHFNVFARKNALKVLAGNYVERAIVPHALGRFEDLLLATAQSPAMLVYLDNDKSAAPRAHGKRGVNENYARELLELHTLGVDGGYTQADVVAVARILTGWGLGDPREQGLAFEFSPERHDFGEKTALGVRYPAGSGQAEGFALLRALARHPATARHIARKLCQRFIEDEPDSATVNELARVFSESDGDLKTVLRALVRLPRFWDERVRGAKLKKPSEFLASALRVLELTLDGTPAIAKASEALGEPPLLYAAPTGYPDRASAWTGGSQLLARMDLSARLVAGNVGGINRDKTPVFSANGGDVNTLVAELDARLFGGLGSAATLAVLREEASRARSTDEARATALTLALGSPEFQRR